MRRWYKGMSNRTFIVYPIAVISFELGLHRGVLIVHPAGAFLLVRGCLQYRFVGRYRVANGGGPGLDVPPKCIVIEGAYRYTRHPIYLGHLIFMAVLAASFTPWLAAALLAFHAVWFQCRVLKDEARLESRFGSPYLAYKSLVKRWI